MLAWRASRAHRPAHEGQRACTTEPVSEKAEPGSMHTAINRQPRSSNCSVWQPMDCLHTDGPGPQRTWPLGGKRICLSTGQSNGSRAAGRHSWQQLLGAVTRTRCRQAWSS